SLLKKTTMNARKKRAWLIAAALLMALPCLAAGAFAVHLNISAVQAQAQEPSREEQEKRELRSRREQEIKEKMERQIQELEEKIKVETNAEVRAKLEQELAEV